LPAVGSSQCCSDSRDGSPEGDDAAPLDLDDSDDDEADHGSAPLMTPPSPLVNVPARAAAAGLGRGALAEQLALSSHVRDLDRPPRV
jgi:hypothetical protein